jgi:hypothetical protein
VSPSSSAATARRQVHITASGSSQGEAGLNSQRLCIVNLQDILRIRIGQGQDGLIHHRDGELSPPAPLASLA